ncbi:MAG: polysaccharide biosynthesis protein, partial [Nanoarchaeota archaeon]
RDKSALRKAMRNIEIVFHAAALKQVPSSEYNPVEAVKTNILGAQNVVDIALEENVERVIAISTDKAVEPVNVMGMSKAIQERIITSANLFKDGKKTVFACVRYGNVLGSRGSVVPLFRKLIESNKPLTLTHKDMTRFIITLNEAIDLVFKATKSAVGGEIFVLKMPSHTINDLAEVMIESLNAKNKEIKISGIRPGEKIHETLVSYVESMRTVSKGNYYIILPHISINDIEKNYPNNKNNNLFIFSSDNAERLNKKELREILNNEGWLDKQEPRDYA